MKYFKTADRDLNISQDKNLWNITTKLKTTNSTSKWSKNATILVIHVPAGKRVNATEPEKNKEINQSCKYNKDFGSTFY